MMLSNPESMAGTFTRQPSRPLIPMNKREHLANGHFATMLRKSVAAAGYSGPLPLSPLIYQRNHPRKSTSWKNKRLFANHTRLIALKDIICGQNVPLEGLCLPIFGNVIAFHQVHSSKIVRGGPKIDSPESAETQKLNPKRGRVPTWPQNRLTREC